MKYIKNRSTELSTITGIGFLMSLLGIQLAPEHVEVIPQVIAAGIAVFAVFKPQNKPKK